MSQDKSVTDVPQENSGATPGDAQPPAEVFSEHILPGTPPTATGVNANEPNPEPSGGAPVPQESAPLAPKEEKAAGGQNEGAESGRSISDCKRAANRENAKHSTGPKTAEGKAASSQNAYKHGLFSSHLIRPGEKGEQYQAQVEEIVGSIAGHYEPVGFLEILLVEKIAVETIRFSRLLDYEQLELNRKNAFWGSGIDRVLRYQATLNRQLFQAMEQLERLQTKRKEQSGPPKDPVRDVEHKSDQT